MAGDLKLDNYDARTRQAIYKGHTPITHRHRLDFNLKVKFPPGNKVLMELDLGSYEADDFDTARKRMALWLRNVAEVLEGEVDGACPLRINRISRNEIWHPKKGQDPQPGDKVVYQTQEWEIERFAADEQIKIKLTNSGHSLFVPIAELKWDVAGVWYISREWSP